MSPTCDTVGVLGTLIHQVAGTQAVEALKILTGHREAVNRHLVSIDAWSGWITNMSVAGVRERTNCVCCKQHRYEYLAGDRIGSATNLCGRGRHETWPSLADRRTWEHRFHTAGLRIEQAIPFVTRTHAHVWDVGLRPIAPLLIRMANALTPQTRREIKRD